MSKKISVEVHKRSGSIRTSSYNEADNSIELVAATEAEVRMYDWSIGTFIEILSMQNGEVRLERINAGANVIDNHDMYSSVREAVVGVVDSARLENGELVCKIRFSSRDDVKGLVQDVKDGITTNISIGYRVYKYEITEEEGQLPVYRAVDWEPFEVSFVSVPADYSAGTRSAKPENGNDAEIISSNKTRNMSTTKTGAAAAPAAEKESGAPDVQEQVRRAVAEAMGADKTRRTDILNAVRKAKLDDAFALELINDETMTVDKARDLVIEKMAGTNTQSAQTRAAVPHLTVGADETDKYRAVASDGLALRSAQVKEKDFKPEAVSAAREYRGKSLLRLAEECLQRSGVNTNRMDQMEIAIRAITSSTSDFVIILENTMNKVLLNSYATTADTWRKFCAIGSVGDFRPHNRYRMGSFGKLDKVGENGEYTTKPITDADKSSISADTYGNQINISRKMIVNDDLGAFLSLTANLGRAAARSIEIDVYALLASNPTMQDGNPLFHASHGNLVTGAAPTAVVFDGMRVAMASQKDKDKNDILDLRPDVLLIGIAQGGTAKVINGALYDPDTANKLQKPNVAHGIFNNIVDTARISGNEYYAFANPSECPVIEVAFLNGMQEPFLENWEEPGKDGRNWRIRSDYGVAALDFRGVVKNPGA